MKRIRYKILGFLTVGDGKVESLAAVDVPYSEENEAAAKKQAYNGEYTIEDDGQPEGPNLEGQVAELYEAINLLLSGVTE